MGFSVAMGIQKSGVSLFAVVLIAGCATPPWPDATPVQCRIDRATVTVECSAIDRDRLTGCEVIEDSAPGCGFGEAALEVAASTRLTPEDVRAPGNGKVRFTTTFGPTGRP